MSNDLNNPAGRLHEVLASFAAIGTRSGAVPLHEVWRQTLHLPAVTDIEPFLARMLDVRILGRQVRQAVKANPSLRVDLHLRSFSKAERLLDAVDFNTDWRGYGECVSDVVLTELALTGHALGLSQPEPTLSAGEIETARAELEAAYVSIKSATMASDIQHSLLSILDAMQAALLRYRTAGIEAFWEAYTQMIGTVVLQYQRHDFKEAFEAPEMGPLRTALKTVATYASTAKDAATVINATVALANVASIAGLLGPAVAM